MFQRTYSSQISQQGRSHVPHSTAHLPPETCTSVVHIFCLPAANDPLPTELKFRVAIPAANDPVPTELKFKENTVK